MDDSWDARAYDKVYGVVEEWGQRVLERRKWQGDEAVLDAGCGSGRPARILAAKVPRGTVYAVDKDQNMVRQAQTNLRDFQNVQDTVRHCKRKIALPPAATAVKAASG